MPQTVPFRAAKRAFLDAFERRYFSALSRATSGCISEMARRAGMERVHLRAYLKRHALGPYRRVTVEASTAAPPADAVARASDAA